MSPVHDDPPHEQMLSEALAIAERVAPKDGSRPHYNTVQEHLSDLSRMVAVWMRVSAASVRAHYNRPVAEAQERGVTVFGVHLPVVEFVKLVLLLACLFTGVVIVALLMGNSISVGPSGVQLQKVAAK